MTEPHCLKCTKKGLACSGLGIRYRFNTGIASRGKFRGKPYPILDAQNEDQNTSSSEKEEFLPVSAANKPDNEIKYASKGELERGRRKRLPSMGRSIPLTLQVMDSKTEFLFAHCM